MTGETGAHTNRPELVAEHGCDTKFAMHALSLGLQGAELLSTGRIILPVPEPCRELLRTVRRGELALPAVLDLIADAERQLVSLQSAPSVADEPDRAWVDGWLHRSYVAYWASR